MDSDLSLEFLRVVEQAAIACAHTMGNGDRHKSDQVAVEAMRAVMDTVPIDGTIVIGEGERDEAPMLYIGEKVGLVNAKGIKSLGLVRFSEVDIAVDPLEGTNLCATGAPNAIAVLAASEKGGLLHAPDLYMEKLVVGPTSKDHVSLDAPVADNLKAIAKALGRDVDDLVVIVLDRPRHEKLIEDIRVTGARIRLIGDGDLSAGITAAVAGSGVHAVMGTGGAPEGVLTAAAMRCLNGEIFARLVVAKPEHEERCRAMGITDFKKVYRSKDLAPGQEHHFRGDRRHRRNADEGRALLRRRQPHQLGDHAERAAPDPVHRQHSRRHVQRRPDPILEACAACSLTPRRRSGTPSRRRRSGFGTAASVALPTDTLYGLAADPFRADAVARVFLVKGRMADRALPLIAADADQVAARLGPLPPNGARLAEKFWPGPLTLLVPAPAALAREVTGGTGRVGVRVPAHEIARAICRGPDGPITATSANRSGQPATADPGEVERTLGDDVDLLIDAGPTPGGAPSTIVDVTGSRATARAGRSGSLGRHTGMAQSRSRPISSSRDRPGGQPRHPTGG